MSKERQKLVYYWTNECKKCGEEFEVSCKDSMANQCQKCEEVICAKERSDVTENLMGAVVIGIEYDLPSSYSSKYIKKIVIKNIKGTIYTLFHDRYIIEFKTGDDRGKK